MPCQLHGYLGHNSLGLCRFADHETLLTTTPNKGTHHEINQQNPGTATGLQRCGVGASWQFWMAHLKPNSIIPYLRVGCCNSRRSWKCRKSARFTQTMVSSSFARQRRQQWLQSWTWAHFDTKNTLDASRQARRSLQAHTVRQLHKNRFSTTAKRTSKICCRLRYHQPGMFCQRPRTRCTPSGTRQKIG